METAAVGNESIKTDVLNVNLNLLNDKLHFNGKSRTNTPVSIDYTPPYGDNLGYTSLELLLLSLSSCVGSSILLILRKMRKTITGLEINSSGVRRDQHPTCFKTITVNFKLKSEDTQPEDFEKALKLSEESFCPVWAMLKNNVEIITNFEIV
jgi:putative redox protein